MVHYGQQKRWSIILRHGHNSRETGVKYRPGEVADRSNTENRCVHGKPAEVWVRMLSHAITIEDLFVKLELSKLKNDRPWKGEMLHAEQ